MPRHARAFLVAPLQLSSAGQSYHPVQRDWVIKSLEVGLSCLIHQELAVEVRMDLRCHEHFSACGLSLNPKRQIDGATQCSIFLPLFRANISDDQSTAIDTDTHAEFRE